MTGKIFRNAFLLGVLVLVIAGALFTAMLRQRAAQETYRSLEAQARLVQQVMDTQTLQDLELEDRVTLIAADGTVLYDSRADQGQMDNHARRPEVLAALRDGSGTASRRSDTLQEEYLYYALRLSDGTVLRLCRTQTSLGALLWSMVGPLMGIAAAVLLVAIAWSLYLAREITKPINEIAPDDPEDTYPELQPLVDKLRQQNRTIRRQMDELNRRVREFAALTEHMSEGFLLLDRQGTVLSGNHSARELLKTEKGADLRRCDDTALRQAVETALSGAHAGHLMERGGSVYQVMANPVQSNGQVAGAVILLLDVTEREQREALRREFSANVSHELKTPLTTISGFAELMSQGLVPPEKVAEFSGDIYRESRRLVALVEDIIKLSHLDEGGADMEWETVDLYELCRQVAGHLRYAADNHQVTMEVRGQPTEIRGSRQLLEEMVYNLCDNAVKYNRPGGWVHVDVSRAQGTPCLTVTDSGIGIPHAHQSRVFERFYRVDKSHSKAIGGTGLGLSIVKHAAQFHNARLELRSQPEQGTQITVFFDGVPAERRSL